MKISWHIESNDGVGKTHETLGELPVVGAAVYFVDYSLDRGIGRARYVVQRAHVLIIRTSVDMEMVKQNIPPSITDGAARFDFCVQWLESNGHGHMTRMDTDRKLFICERQEGEVTMHEIKESAIGGPA